MISGYLSSEQELLDLLNSCLFNKVGIIDLFLGFDMVSLRIESGLIKGFRLTGEEELIDKNKKAVLLYHLSEFLENSQAFFTFREGEMRNMVEIEEPIQVEELVLQLQLVRAELSSLMERVITPMAVIKVLKHFDEADLYQGRSIYNILVSTKNSLVEEIRKLNSLFASGYIDISQFHGPETKDRSISIEYMMRGIEVNRINLVSLLESLRLGKFDGLIEIMGDDFEFNMYYKRGKLIAIYPCNYEVFDFLLSPRSGIRMNVISIPQGILDLFMLRHAEEKSANGLLISFFDVGRTFMGMAMERKSGMITIYSEGSRSYILFREGALLCVIREEGDELKISRRIYNTHVGWVDMVFYQNMENIKYLVYQYFFNLVYGLLLKHASHLNQLIFAQLSLSETLKYQEGTIVYRQKPSEEEAFGFLQFLLDLSYNVLGHEMLEKELEMAIEPYRELLKIFEVDRYFKLPER